MSNYQSIHGSAEIHNDGDANLLQRLGIALSTRRRAGWHLVHFSVHNGEVKLAGVVPSFYDRQLIANLVRHVAGVLRVRDELAVGEPSIRQQVANVDHTSNHVASKVEQTAPQNPFRRLPVVSDSLESILAGQAASVVLALR